MDDPTEFVSLSSFFQRNNFQIQLPEGGASKNLPTDGQFYDIAFSLDGLTSMDVVDQTGINLANHSTDLRIKVDSIRFIPEPTTGVLALAGAFALLTPRRRRR